MIRRTLIAATILATPFALGLQTATAQPVQGLYLGGGGGLNWLDNSKFAPSASLGMPGTNVHTRMGWGAVGSVGYGFDNGFRVELEGNYRSNEFKGLSGGAFASGGAVRSYGAMVNGLFDFDIGSPYIYPYVGLGAGYSWHNLRKVRAASAPLSFSSNDTAGGLAYQGIAGVAVPIAAVPGLSATAEYRYYADHARRDFAASSTIGVVTSNGTVRMKDDTANHSVLVGLRYAFNVPAPAPMAAAAPAPAPVATPAPAPARTYLVFFDWDRADLSTRASTIIRDAAEASRKTQVVKLEVNGHADLSGTSQYNQGLSMRRAQVVAAELVRDGVAQTAIMINAYGDSRPLVPTARGVREPQNRRVEIILR